MALEDLTGSSKYIDALDTANPTGIDAKSEGDDHLRGVKNVLKNTFPNVSGAVTATHGLLNSIIEAATVMAFFQASAPTGWTQDVTAGINDRMLRVVNTAGGASAGTVSPINLSHVHTTNGHTLAESEMPAHTHNVVVNSTGDQGSDSVAHWNVNTNYQYSPAVVTSPTGGGGSHTHGDVNSASIVPKYVDMIICTKDAV